MSNEKNDKLEINIDTNLYDHLKPENRAKVKAAEEAAKTNSSDLTKIIAFSVLGLIVVGLALNGAFTGEFGGDNNSNNEESNVINTNNAGGFIFLSDQCLDAGTGTNQHFEAILSITVFGELQQIPSGIGDGILQQGEKSDPCVRPIHIHGGGQTNLHIEIPSDFNGQAILGDFFAIWSAVYGVDAKLSSTQLLSLTGTVTLQSNGVIVPILNPNEYPLRRLTSSNELISLTLT